MTGRVRTRTHSATVLFEEVCDWAVGEALKMK